MVFRFLPLLVVALLPLALPDASAAGDACSRIDLRNTETGRKVFGSARDQGNTDACYAYMAADLISYELGERISPIDIYARAGSRGGKAGNALRKLLADGGFCREADFPALAGLDESALHRLSTDYRSLRKATRACKDAPASNACSRAMPICERIDDEFGPLVALFGLDRIIRIIDAQDAQSGARVRTLSAAACNGKRINVARARMAAIRVTSSPRIAGLGIGESGVRRIDRVLERLRPAGVGLCTGIIRGESQWLCDHQATLIGRERHGDGGCWYLVRDSKGRNCDYPETKGIRCERNSGKDTGYFWMREDLLARSADMIEVIE